MRKVILTCAVTADGLIEGPNGEYDWCRTEEGPSGLVEFLHSVDAVFYGRKSWELFGIKIPDGIEHPLIKEIWELTFSKKPYVFSNTLKTAERGAVVIGGDFAAEVNKIKQQPGKDIWLYGGASLVTSFINAGLVDEFRLAVHPIILGPGKRLFNDIKDRHKLKLIESKPHSSGVVLQRYELAD
jgi:dihydrofolate reductase